VQAVTRGLELLHHLGSWHEALIVVMPAFFREALVFEMERRDAGALKRARRGLGVERIAVAGIGIGDDRYADDVDHRGEAIHDRIHGEQPEIGNAARSGDGSAARIDRAEARLLDQSRRQSVIGARRHRDPAGRQKLA